MQTALPKLPGLTSNQRWLSEIRMRCWMLNMSFSSKKSEEIVGKWKPAWFFATRPNGKTVFQNHGSNSSSNIWGLSAASCQICKQACKLWSYTSSELYTSTDPLHFTFLKFPFFHLHIQIQELHVFQLKTL